jgi:hypothetical protein
VPTGRRRPHEPKVIGAAQAALIIGVRQSNLRTLAGLPDPYDKVSSGTLWREDEIRAFADARRDARQAA